MKLLIGITLLIAMPCAGWLFFRNPSLMPVPERTPVESQESTGDEVSNEPIIPLPQYVKLDERKVALGRELFNEPRLSHDGSVSCASCHALKYGGADRKVHSVGYKGLEGTINAPTVLNCSLNFAQFWDGRASTLEEQLEGPLTNPNEMASNWKAAIATLSESNAYARTFHEIYPTGVTIENAKNAIATYERSLITPNCRFDRFLRGDNSALNDDEKSGYRLFKTLGCTTCHQGAGIGGNMYQPLGIMSDYFVARGKITEADYGRYNVTRREEDRFKFKVPMLRNVELTGPYFHDGSAATLEEAVTIMAKYQLGVSLEREKADLLVKFLKTLTGEIKEDR